MHAVQFTKQENENSSQRKERHYRTHGKICLLSTHSQRSLKKILLYHVPGQAMELCTERRIKVYFSSIAVNIE